MSREINKEQNEREEERERERERERKGRKNGRGSRVRDKRNNDHLRNREGVKKDRDFMSFRGNPPPPPPPLSFSTPQTTKTKTKNKNTVHRIEGEEKILKAKVK